MTVTEGPLWPWSCYLGRIDTLYETYRKVKSLSTLRNGIWGSGGTAPLIFKLDSSWRRVVNFTRWSPKFWERNAVPTELVAGWAAEPVWTFWRRERFNNSKHEDVAKRLGCVWIINVGLLTVERYVLILGSLICNFCWAPLYTCKGLKQGLVAF